MVSFDKKDRQNSANIARLGLDMGISYLFSTVYYHGDEEKNVLESESQIIHRKT